jgi:hypothetical protein
MRKYILLILACTALESATAQKNSIKGYLGKRFFVELGLKGALRFARPGYNTLSTIDTSYWSSLNNGSGYGRYSSNRDYSEIPVIGALINLLSGGPTGIDLKMSASANYVIGRRTAIGLRYERFNTGMFIYLPYLYQDKTSGYYQNIDNYYRFAKYNFGLQNHKIGLNFHFYKKKHGALAPYGGYISLGLGIINSQLVDNQNNIAAHKKKYGSTLYNPQLAVNMGYLDLGVGKKWILKDLILLDVGATISLVSGSSTLGLGAALVSDDISEKKEYLLSDSRGSYSSAISSKSAIEKLERYHAETLVSRIAASYFMNLKCGIGFLIF